MYEDLFAELDLELMKATKGIKKLDLKLNTTKKQMNIVSKQEQLPKTYKHIEKQSPSFPFAKSLRFNPKKDQALDETQLSFASFSTNPSLDSIKTKGPAIVFSKSDRFVSETSNLEEEAKELNPNYEITKKKAAVLVVYKQPTNKPKSLFNKKEIESIVESVDNEPGPGDYELKFNLIERKVNGGNFYRADRFKKDENDEMQEDINPNYDIVKPKVKTTVIKLEIEKNEKLMQRKRFEQFLQIIQAKYHQIKPIENDKLLQNHVPNTYIGPHQTEDKIARKSDLLKFFNLADKMNELRRRGPGEYHVEKKLDGPCMVVYRSCSPVIRNPLKDKRPAPNQYIVKDNLIKEAQPNYTFKKSPKHKKMKMEDLDWKKPLNLDQKATKLRAANAIILPEQNHKNRRPRALSDIRANRLGPGLYNMIYDLVEARKSKGVVPYKLTPFNEREVQMDFAQKDIFDGELDPNYDYNKPRKPEFKYYEPIEWNPPHPSDGMLFRERWRFYDSDINKIRPEIKPIDFAKNLNMKEFVQFEFEFKLLENYLQRRKKVPELGHYQIGYNQIDKSVPVPDLDKMKEREEKEITPSDELILNPDKPKPKIQTLDFEKQKGRETKDVPVEERLLIEPNFNQIDKKIPGMIEFNKILERTEKNPNNNNEELLLQPDYNYIDPKVKGNADFGKIISRNDDPLNKINIRTEECIINPKEDLVRPHTANLVQMNKGGERFKKTCENEEFADNKRHETDIIQAYEAIKPEKNMMKFDGYSGREKTKIKITKKPSNLYQDRSLKKKNVINKE